MYFKHRKDQGQKAKVISVFIFLGIFLITALLFAWGKSLLQNYRREQAITAFKSENERLMNDNKKFLKKIALLKSEQFKDKWAKERKGKSNIGEKVLILPTQEEKDLREVFQTLTERERKMEILKKSPKKEQWWTFFFGEQI